MFGDEGEGWGANPGDSEMTGTWQARGERAAVRGRG